MNTTNNDTLIQNELSEFIRNFNYWLMIIGIVIAICGICGNGLALIVVNRRPLRNTSTSVFITYLAIFDSSILMIHISSLIIFRSIRSYIIHCLLIYLIDFVTFSSVWIMVIMTIERCIAVHSPFLAKRYCTIQRTRHSIYLLLFIGLTFFTLTFPIIYTIDDRQNKCIIRIEYQMLLRIVKPIIFYFVPDVILLINLFIIYELFMARRYRTRTLMNPEDAVNQINAASFNRKQQQLTLMLVTVSLSFYLFTTPAIIDYICQRHPPTYRDVKRLKMRFLRANFSVLCLQMNSATNFLFYCLTGSKFRRTCLQTLKDIYFYIRTKFDENYYRQQISTDIRRCSTFGIEMRHDSSSIRRKSYRSSSLQPAQTTCQFNRRRTSSSIYNVHEF